MPDRYLNVFTYHHQQEKFVCRNICKIFRFHMNKRKASLMPAPPDTNSGHGICEEGVILGLLRSPEIIFGKPPENNARMENHSVAAVRRVYSIFDLFTELSYWQWYDVFCTGFINKPIIYEELCCKSAVASSATLRNVGLLADMFKLRT